MKSSQTRGFAIVRRMFFRERVLIFGVLLSLACAAMAQQDKGAPAKTSLTGHYEGTAKNKAGEVIQVTIDLVEKGDTLAGNISSSHGDFAITGGSRQSETITIEFDTGGPAGTISVRLIDDKLVGTWSAGDDSGSVEVKRTAVQEKAPKDKSSTAMDRQVQPACCE